MHSRFRAFSSLPPCTERADVKGKNALVLRPHDQILADFLRVALREFQGEVWALLADCQHASELVSGVSTTE